MIGVVSQEIFLRPVSNKYYIVKYTLDNLYNY